MWACVYHVETLNQCHRIRQCRVDHKVYTSKVERLSILIEYRQNRTCFTGRTWYIMVTTTRISYRIHFGAASESFALLEDIRISSPELKRSQPEFLKSVSLVVGGLMAEAMWAMQRSTSIALPINLEMEVWTTIIMLVSTKIVAWSLGFQGRNWYNQGDSIQMLTLSHSR
jgi:hypothetical protein